MSHGDPAVMVTGAAYVDNRTPVPAGLFVAIVGERVDGHEYAAGAHAVLGSRPTVAPTVVVADPVVALGRLARHVVDRTPATVLALTGSVGKTGTKDYLASVLERLAGPERVIATEGNGNNEIGVPLTVLRAGAATDYLVVEMGARGIGHIAYLCDIAPPRIAAALNVGTAHVGEFGGREQIALAKGEIVEALPADGRGGAQRRRPAGGRDGVADEGTGGDVRPRRRGAATTRWSSTPWAARVHARPRRRGAPGPAAPDGRTPGAERDRGRRDGRRRRLPARRRRRGAVRGHRRVPLADGGARAPRRDGRRQRRLQRQPRLDARRARGAGRDRAGARAPYRRRAGTDAGARHRARGRPPVGRCRRRPARRRRRRRGRRTGSPDRRRDRRCGRSGRDQDRGARRGTGLGAAECRSGGRRPREGVPGGGARMGRRAAAG